LTVDAYSAVVQVSITLVCSGAGTDRSEHGVDIGAVLWISGQDALDMEAASDEEVCFML
jgi:hypothetical protein